MTNGSDFELLRLDRALTRLDQEIEAGVHYDGQGEVKDEALNRATMIEPTITHLPATTLAGIAVKVRRLKASIEDGEVEWDDVLADTTLKALGGGA